MSDALRKPLSDQAGEKITPDSQKSTLDKAKETVTGAGDRAAGTAQPEDQKSYTQQAGDAIRGGSDNTSREGQSISQTVTDTVNQGVESAKNALGINNPPKQ
ncbi:hypothetical protein P152DRAFT_462067 [Eremomyces bilateralis CBS 781.70]|uniref:Chaperone/heat shock protein Hsp12 n=1 Tax=Eremomyces bilateralis CBS 781.70 TaxID=1392243 RepID=A0A6G1FST5_9PEZI|nr:uncharacterized protein P152DRAFT_462067 [Eremomyces bilateralis CBS 781.70]KAF1808834.1 hypothetical protein P152DRAFT_462067 [Eremomyces bilateralis CBS 781.70]